MSAWRVHTRHIDFLVAAMAAIPQLADYLPADAAGGVDRDELGRELLEENYHSVDSKYGQYERRPVYRYTEIELPDLSTINGLLFAHNVVSSYEYQSCEHDGWERSQAHDWSSSLRVWLEDDLHARGVDPSDTAYLNGWAVGPKYSPQLAASAEMVE